jgi:hypothetical protein
MNRPIFLDGSFYIFKGEPFSFLYLCIIVKKLLPAADQLSFQMRIERCRIDITFIGYSADRAGCLFPYV